MTHQPEQGAVPRISDIAYALGLLSRLPVPVDGAAASARGPAAAWSWPVAGAVLGVLAGLVAEVLLRCGVPSPVVALLAVAQLAIMTGAMHEDGLADAADGLWGGWDKARRLEIMKDSRTGAYGVIALVLGLGLRAAALSVIASPLAALIAVAALSRTPMVVLMAALPNARGDGLSASVGRPAASTCAIAIFVALLIAVLAIGPAAAAATLAVALAATVCAVIARAKIGGQTGDILGATQQVCEIAALIALAAVLT